MKTNHTSMTGDAREDLTQGVRLSRRTLLKGAGMMAAASMTVSLLAACADDADDPVTEPDTDDDAAVTPDVEPEPDEDEDDEEDVDVDDDDTEDEPEVGTGGDVNVYWRNTPASPFAPFYTTSAVGQTVERCIFGTLIKVSDVLEPTPDLADSVEMSDDAMVYTFHLGQNHQFTDGEPLTAEDVVFTLESVLDRRTGSYWAGRLSHIEGAAEFGTQDADSVSGIDMPDDYTVELTLTEPDAVFLVTLGNFCGLGIVPKHVLEDVAPDQMQEHPFWLAPDVTAGPFRFVRHETDQYVELAKNEDFGGTQANVERIFLRILTGDVALAQLERGEVDVMTIPVSEVERTEQLPNVDIVSVPSAGIALIAFNMRRESLQDRRLRQAMMCAIDREGILREVYLDNGHIVNSPIFGPDWMGTPEGLDPYEYDPDRARALLEEMEWDTSQVIEMIYGPLDPEKDTSAVIMQEQWREVGVNIEIQIVDWSEHGERTIQTGDYDISYGGGGVFRGDPSVAGTFFHSDNFAPLGGNSSHYSNPDLDQLFEEGRAAADLDERREIYTQAAQILNEDLPWLFLWSQNSIHGVSQRLQGYAAPAHEGNKLWNAEEWSVTD